MTYETARKSLEQAVAIDPTFALAHASLARAYDELDYTDRAKDSMLRAVAAAQDSRLSDADDRKLRALQFMVSRDYARAAPLVQEIEAEARVPRSCRGRARIGLARPADGRLRRGRRGVRSRAALDPSYAAAKLRLGFMLRAAGRQGRTSARGVR